MKLPKSSRDRLKAEMADADLGDSRRNQRLVQMMDSFAVAPNASLPEIFQSDAELEAAYRFLRSQAFDFFDLLHEHQERTSARAREVRRVLVVHDTTDMTFNHVDIGEIGCLQTGKPGFYVHVSLAVDATNHRRPLGIVHAEPYFREERSRRGGRTKRASGKETATWKDREFLRWHRGVEQSADRLDGCEVVHVMDREGDCYALFSDMVATEQDFVVRCRIDRTLANSEKLFETISACDGVLEREVELSRRVQGTIPARRKTHPSRPQRKAQLEFRACSVTLRRPRSASKESHDEIQLNVVRVDERNAPEGQTPVSWTLWTTLPIASSVDVANVVDAYRQRWIIEEYFKALKTGCAYEARLLETRHALLNLLAISMPIAIEVLWLRARAWEDPDAPATDVVTPLQIQILRSVGHRPLDAKPTVAQALLCVASLAGHQLNNGPPGWLILMRGYKKLADYEVGWAAAQRHGRKKM